MKLKQDMDKAFTIKDLGELRYFLSIEISRSPTNITLQQRKYATDILLDMGLTACKPALYPLLTNLKLFTDSGDVMQNPENYRKLIVRLLYLNITRSDMSYAIQNLSQFLSCPRELYMKAALHLLRYLKGTINAGLSYPI